MTALHDASSDAAEASEAFDASDDFEGSVPTKC